MNPDNKSPNQTTIQPDYSFIVNQPDANDKKEYKKRDTKVVIIIILLVVMTLLLIAGSLINAVNKAQKEQESINSGTGAQKVTDAERTVIKDFLERIQEEDYDGAYELIDDETTYVTAKQLEYDMEPLQVAFKLNECSINDTKSKSVYDTQTANDSSNQSPTLYVTASCPGKEKSSSFKIEILIKDFGAETRIVNYGKVETE